MRPKFVIEEETLVFLLGAQQSLHPSAHKTTHTTYHTAYQDIQI